jgi:hypothetical protein
VIGLFGRKYRYYCRGNPRCRWEGLLPARPAATHDAPLPAYLRKAAFALALALLVLVTAAALWHFLVA